MWQVGLRQVNQRREHSIHCWVSGTSDCASFVWARRLNPSCRPLSTSPPSSSMACSGLTRPRLWRKRRQTICAHRRRQGHRYQRGPLAQGRPSGRMRLSHSSNGDTRPNLRDSRDEVTRIQQRRAEWVSVDAACTLAGVPPTVLEHMMSASVILADVNWRQDLLKGGPVASASLSALFDRIGSAAEPVTVGNEETLTWAGLTSRRMGDKQAIQTVMQAIANGRVRAIARGRRLGDLVFRRDDVTAYFGTPLLEAGMSIQQLSKFTGWKWESIVYWIDEGLLESNPFCCEDGRVVSCCLTSC